jgi:hypothetical protein
MCPTRFLACLFAVVLPGPLWAAETNVVAKTSVPVPTKDWRYVPCENTNADIALVFEYSVGEVLRNQTNKLYFCRAPAQDTKQGERHGCGFGFAGGPTGICLDGFTKEGRGIGEIRTSGFQFSGIVSPSEPKDTGVEIRLNFERTDEDHSKTTIDETLLVPYDEAATYFGNGLSFKVHFEPVNAYTNRIEQMPVPKK